jgi:hypothetical protein
VETRHCRPTRSDAGTDSKDERAFGDLSDRLDRVLLFGCVVSDPAELRSISLDPQTDEGE